MEEGFLRVFLGPPRDLLDSLFILLRLLAILGFSGCLVDFFWGFTSSRGRGMGLELQIHFKSFAFSAE